MARKYKKYKYVQGDCVIEFERHGERRVVCCSAADVSWLPQAAKDDKDYAWTRIEMLWNEQN